jgi:Cu2+-exporting ATPase
VEANPVAQTATVEYDPRTTSVEALQQWVEGCGYHCAGRSVPGHVCDPLAEEGRDAPAHDHAAVERAEHAHGDGHGGHAGMSMAAMVRDMRNRFLVAALFAIPIALWSPAKADALPHTERLQTSARRGAFSGRRSTGPRPLPGRQKMREAVPSTRPPRPRVRPGAGAV